MLRRHLEYAISKRKGCNMTMKHVAIIFRKQKILGTGYNRVDKPYLQSPNVNSTHAEIDAISNRRFPSHSKSKYDILVISINPDGKLRNSRPCVECIKHLRKSNISHIYYSDENGQICRENVQRMSGYKSSGNMYRLRLRLQKQS